MTTASPGLISPCGEVEEREQPTLAPRPATLRGARLTLLDNGKVNGGQLLDMVADLLVREHGVVLVGTVTKQWAGQPLGEAERVAIAETSDLVITAIGDCGSCSAATVADGILLEQQGLPTASICTTPFDVTGRAISQSYGFPGYQFVRVEHPVASLDRAGLERRAKAVLADVVAVLGAPA